MLRLPVSPVRPLVGAYAICGVFSAKSFKWLFQLLELFSVRSENVILFHDEDDMLLRHPIGSIGQSSCAIISFPW